MKLNAEQKLKNQFDIEKIHDAGKILAGIFASVRELDLEGMTTLELDEFVEQQINKNKVRPAFKTVVGYNHATCISLNNEVVHGIPSKKKQIAMGDLVKIDIGIVKQGYFADSCITIEVPPVSKEAKKLVKITKKCLELGIEAARPGNTLGDIGFAIQNFAESKGYSVVRDFTGHGTGFALHEPPTVFHYGEQGKGLPLCAGMVIAIEPMINVGTYETIVLEDGWTAVTGDGSLSAQFEHTVAVTESGPMILTN